MIALALGLLAMETDALALSCAEPQLGQVLDAVRDANGSQVVAVGAVVFPDGPPDPKQALVRPTEVDLGRVSAASGRFTGTLIGPGTRREVKDLEVRVEVTCISAWCGWVPVVDAEHPAWLHVLQVTGDPASPGYTLTLGACGGTVFAPPPAAEIDAFSASWTP